MEIFARTSQQTTLGQAYYSDIPNSTAWKLSNEPFAICEITLPPTPPRVLIQPAPNARSKKRSLNEALAEGTQQNILCEIDTWRWSVSSEARTRISQRFPLPNFFCIDADADGFSPINKDADDSNPQIKPTATETTNMIDDDGNDNSRRSINNGTNRFSFNHAVSAASINSREDTGPRNCYRH